MEEIAFPSREENPIRLEGKLHIAGPDRPTAVVLHPSSQGECDMEHPIVVRLCLTLNEDGWNVLRFNFRGNGRSQGELAHGAREAADVGGALDYLEGRGFAGPIYALGHSFGAAMAIRAALEDQRVRGFVAIGLPLHRQEPRGSLIFPFYHFDARALLTYPRPKFFLVGSQDRGCPSGELAELAGRLPPPAGFRVIEGADHYFGQTRRLGYDLNHPAILALAQMVREWARGLEG